MLHAALQTYFLQGGVLSIMLNIDEQVNPHCLLSCCMPHVAPQTYFMRGSICVDGSSCQGPAINPTLLDAQCSWRVRAYTHSSSCREHATAHSFVGSAAITFAGIVHDCLAVDVGRYPVTKGVL
jgi:hypothetical protein